MPADKDPDQYYEHHVFCCTNQRDAGHPRGCCLDRGAGPLRDYMKAACKRFGKKIRINSAGCLDRCELGPVMAIYPEGVWYTYENESDIDEIIQVHLVDGRRVERLMLRPTDNFPEDRKKRSGGASDGPASKGEAAAE
jgi:(2Fe-2S) ferredoxin